MDDGGVATAVGGCSGWRHQQWQLDRGNPPGHLPVGRSRTLLDLPPVQVNPTDHQQWTARMQSAATDRANVFASCDRGELNPQNFGFAFLGPPSLQPIDTSSKDSSWKHVLYIEPLPTVFRPTLDLLKVTSRLKYPVFHHHHALQTAQLPIGWRNILGAAGVSYWWTQKQDIIERNP